MTLIKALLIMSQLAGAQTIAIQAPSSSREDYIAYLAAHREYSSPSSWINARRPDDENRKKLIEKFADAQEAYLSRDVASARRRFSAVLDDLTTDDWSASERQILLQSALRLAQLADTESEQDKWLELSLAVDPEATVDEALFPPPLLAARTSRKAAATKIVIEFKNEAKDWDLILVNGIRCAPDSCPRFFVTEHPIRVTWLSDKWESVSQVVPINKTVSVNPRRRPWLTGKCQAFAYSDAAREFRDKVAFFDEACLLKAAAQKTAADLKPAPKDSSALTVFQSSPQAKPVYKSPWFWAGVGVGVALVMAAVNQNKSSDRSDPTTTYGY